MKKDSKANEIIQQLDLEEERVEARGDDGLQGDNRRTQVASETKSEVLPTPMSLAQSPRAQSPRQQQLQGQAGMHGFFPAMYGAPAQQQQLIWQGLAAQQNLEWQRQQAAFAQMGAAYSMWGNTMGNWNTQRPLPLAVPVAAGLPQQGLYPTSSRQGSHVDPPTNRPSVGAEDPPQNRPSDGAEDPSHQDPPESSDVDPNKRPPRDC